MSMIKKTKQPLLSIIVPFHNNEKFIIEALQSLFEQINDEVEVIIIDDGSDDNSNMLVENFLGQQHFERVSFFSQVNQGIAETRNVGLQKATGIYVTFLDGDDILSPVYYSTLAPSLRKGEFDIIDFNFREFSEFPPTDEVSENISCTPYDFKSSEIDCLKPIFERSNWHLWSRIFRRELLKGDTFVKGRRYEDVIFTPFQYFKTKKIAHIDEQLYFYRINESGITRNIKNKDIEDILFAMYKMLYFIKTHENDAEIAKLVSPMIENCFIEVKKMTKKIYGYYYYPPATVKLFKLAASLCKNTSLSRRKYFQMKYPLVDTYISKINSILKIR
ncbi:glycosyltransferase [Hafnia psychrotolerans]|uniref:Glycosyl transferase n=1 Tax=Hafnia psychrotolerans TaxID=1477018 RepID=A0ABQ1GTQ2_9GAMM|nr:glycosyltransferase [Hafnia psychrotolerans]GGA50193.1 glycosyl transferase [Hafnia psychrotolerans]